MTPPPEKPHPSRRGSPWSLLGLLLPEAPALDLRILGRALLHAALVGAAAGLIGAGFFAALEYAQKLLLEELAGYVPLRAYGEQLVAEGATHTFRPWLLILLPAAGALVAGAISIVAPETRGGGGDAMIHAFHHHGGVMRRRVIWAKALTSLFTLSTGGAGGREGPTMQIGGALGSLVGRVIRVGTRERRVLMVAGVAAGMAAVFRTPLGAALLAIEVLYRDDFESEALIPAILASVIAYSVVISIYGESTLFARAPRYPFVPAHLPLYALLAILLTIVATLFLKTLRAVQRISARLPVTPWARPAIGGLALGIFAVPVILYVGSLLDRPGQGLGLLGGGYGAAQMAITGSEWLPDGWGAVELLLLLGGAKLVAASLTIGTGGSAGDFAPSLVLGGVFGGAFGRAAQLILGDPRIDPGAFALVGMGTFYGGIAHAPVSSLIMVCELAGSYDLLVPLMLAEGVAFVTLRKKSLYEAQVVSRKESPVHREPELDVLGAVRVRDVVTRDRPYVSFAPATPTKEMKRRMAEAAWQDAFPVVDSEGALKGIVTSDLLRIVSGDADIDWTIAADVMQPPVVLREDDDLRTATKVMLANGLREIPVTGEGGRIVGFLDEAEVSKAYLEATTSAEPRAP